MKWFTKLLNMVATDLPQNIPGENMVTTAEYIAVLQNEIDILKKDYYKPNTAGGTGHFGTAIGVLEMRIREIQKEAIES